MKVTGNIMPFFNYPDGTVVVVPQLFRAWACIVRDHDGLGALVPATSADDLMEEAAAFLRSFGPAKLDGGLFEYAHPNSRRRPSSLMSICGRFETAS
jgi:hypothetical protein